MPNSMLRACHTSPLIQEMTQNAMVQCSSQICVALVTYLSRRTTSSNAPPRFQSHTGPRFKYNDFFASPWSNLQPLKRLRSFPSSPPSGICCLSTSAKAERPSFYAPNAFACMNSSANNIKKQNNRRWRVVGIMGSRRAREKVGYVVRSYDLVSVMLYTSSSSQVAIT